MQKLDRLGWAAGISFTAFGARIGIRVSEPEILKRLPEYLPPSGKPSAARGVDQPYSARVGGAGPRDGVRHYHLIYGGPERLVRTTEIDAALEALEADIHLYVAMMARRRVFVHAGVVGWKGKAIVVPGQGMSGKTSLVAAL